jgi:hypothetical protein
MIKPANHHNPTRKMIIEPSPLRIGFSPLRSSKTDITITTTRSCPNVGGHMVAYIIRRKNIFFIYITLYGLKSPPLPKVALGLARQ